MELRIFVRRSVWRGNYKGLALLELRDAQPKDVTQCRGCHETRHARYVASKKRKRVKRIADIVVFGRR